MTYKRKRPVSVGPAEGGRKRRGKAQTGKREAQAAGRHAPAALRLPPCAQSGGRLFICRLKGRERGGQLLTRPLRTRGSLTCLQTRRITQQQISMNIKIEIEGQNRMALS